MSYLTNIGLQPRNQSGVGARGYHVFRRRLTVSTRWGRVLVLPGQIPQFKWATTPRLNRKRFSSLDAAMRCLRSIQKRKEGRGYRRLPKGQRIK